jgi:GTP-binding protein HflX
MGLGDEVGETLIEALNKIDLMTAVEREALSNRTARSNNPAVMVSAIKGDGCRQLIAAIDKRITKRFKLIEVSLGYDDGASLAWLYDHGEVVERLDKADAIYLKVRLDAADWARFEQRRR